MTSAVTKIDLKPLKAITETLRAKLKMVPTIMRSAVDLAAMEERTGKTYVDRTGKLTQQTKGRTVRATGAEIRVEVGMYRDYSGYVYARGLTVIDSAFADAKEMIEGEFRRLGI